MGSLPVLRRIHREGGDCVVCESPSGAAIAIPIWMTEPSVCAALSVGPPVVSLSALRALRTFLLLTRPSPQFNTIELRFQFRYAAPQPPRLLQLDSSALWFSAAGAPPTVMAADRHKVEPADVQQALTELGAQARYSQLRQQIMTLTECSKRTAQTAITVACQQGWIVQADGHYCLPQ